MKKTTPLSKRPPSFTNMPFGLRHSAALPGGVWSAAPTPFTSKWEIDLECVRRMVSHHFRLGIKGLFLCGTNGEGPWMTDDQRRAYVRAVIRHVRGRIPIAVQVTDNSETRIFANMKMARDEGADIAVIAPPCFFFNPTPDHIRAIYSEAIEKSPLPVGIYDRGKYGSVFVPDNVLRDLYAHPKVVIVKDSSAMPERMKIALGAKRRRPSLRILDGDEFNCVKYIAAGYDGLLLGGGVFNGYLAQAIIDAVQADEPFRAEKLQTLMNNIMFAAYGGKKISCWLAGEKQLLVRMGIFKTWLNYPRYPLTQSCRHAIDKTFKQNREWLLP